MTLEKRRDKEKYPDFYPLSIPQYSVSTFYWLGPMQKPVGKGAWGQRAGE